MGASESKSKLVPFEKITLNVLKLLSKLGQTQEPMNATVKDQIVVALEIYLKQVKEKLSQDNKEYLHALKHVIKFAKTKVNEMPKIPESFQKIEQKSSEQLRIRLMESVKKLNGLAAKDYQNELNEVTQCLQNLKCLEDYIKPKSFDYEKYSAELFLELFIGTTVISLNTVDEILKTLTDPSIKKNAKLSNYVNELKMKIKNDNPSTHDTCMDATPALQVQSESVDDLEELTKRNYSQLINESQSKICVALQSIETSLKIPIPDIFKQLVLADNETQNKQTKTAGNTEAFNSRIVSIDDILEEFLHKLGNCVDKFEILADYFVKQLKHDLRDLEDLVVGINQRTDTTLTSHEKNVEDSKVIPLNYLEEASNSSCATKSTSANSNGEKTENKNENEQILEETANSTCDVNTGIMQVGESQDENFREDSRCIEHVTQCKNDSNPLESLSDNDSEKKTEVDPIPENVLMNHSNEKELSTSETLDKVKIDVFLSVESFPNFWKKKQALLQGVEEVQEITTTDEETYNKKVLLLNKMEGFLVAEAMDYLDNLQKKIEHHKSYAEQFPYPDSIPIYEEKRKTIESRKKQLDNLSEIKYSCIDSKKNSIAQQIDEALNILEEKAKNNSQLMIILDNLGAIEKKIGEVDSPNLIKSLEFRQQIDSISETHHRLISKKKQIFHNIQQIEENFYETKYNKITETKKTLDELLNKLKSKVSTHEDSDKQEMIAAEDLELFNKYKEKSEAMDELIEEIMNEVKERHKAEEVTPRRSFKRTSTLTRINANLLKLNLKLAKEGLSEKEIQINQLKEDVGKKNHLTDPDVFKKLLNKVFLYKEYIRELPNDSELNSKKDLLSQEIGNILKDLDEQVAERVINQKHTEHIIELNREFSVCKEKSTENIEIIQYVKQKAESYKTQIDSFLGTSSSVDYYIVEEKLQLLLDKLDRLNCTDANLINQLVETMNYIKESISKLELNASEDN